MKKMHTAWHLLLLSLLLVGLVTVLAACNGSEPAPTGTATATEEQTPTTAEPSAPVKPTYTADTTVFESFEDMRDNLSLYRDQIPCVRSTKGYYAAGDGGAATYSIVSAKPTGAFEKLGSGVWATLVLDEENPQVNPQQFGAKGDGVINDTTAFARALNFASQNGVTLVLPNGKDYYNAQPVVLENIKIHSDGGKISYHGLAANAPAVDVRNNVTITGTLNVWAIDNSHSTGNHGGRCGVGIGDYGTGAGYSNIHIEHLVVTGGIPGGNAVFVTGDSHDITIDRITVPSGTKYWRGFLAHWGNANDHWPEDGVYQHKENWKPTKHPYDIHLGVVDCTDFRHVGSGADNDKGAVVISAGYDITVDEVKMENSAHTVVIIVGDLMFEYADPAIKAHGMRNIKFGKITSTNSRNAAIFASGTTRYTQNADAKIQLEIGEADVSPSLSNKYLMNHFTGLQSLKIGTLTVRNAVQQAVYIGDGCKNVEIETINAIDCWAQALKVNYSETNLRVHHVKVGTINATRSGRNSENCCVQAPLVTDLQIGTVNLDGCTYKAVLAVTNESFDVTVDSVVAKDSSLSAIVYAEKAVSAENNVSVGTVTGTNAPMTLGTCVLVSKKD